MGGGGGATIKYCRNKHAVVIIMAECGELATTGSGLGMKPRKSWMTPCEFEIKAGRSSSKDWKKSMLCKGKPLIKEELNWKEERESLRAIERR